MSSTRWFTKEDIINDLAEVTGRRVANIDDRFAVRGERPPPVIVSDEEDEFVQMNGQYANRHSNIAEPDLSGITHMLRMVNEYYDSATFDDNENIKELMKTADTVINISKLDPNVPEFIPKNVGNSESETKNVVNCENVGTSELKKCLEIKETCSKSLDNKHIVCKDRKENDKTDANHNETNNNDIDVTKKIDVSSLNSNDIKEITAKLKMKIVGATKTECLKQKRERNLAMASLLKLYTNIPKTPKNDPPPKLMTPEYFQTVPVNGSSSLVSTEREESITKVEIKQDVDKEVLNSKHPSHEASPSSLKIPVTSQESCDLSSNKTIDLDIETQNNHILMSKEIEESVKKVDKWLNGPEKKKNKPREVFFGTVTLKRKDTSSGNSSETRSLSIADNVDSPSSTQTSDSFVPSSYANKLTESYMKRSQSKQFQNEDMWTKLERQLKEKDKVIKERSLSTQVQK